MTTEARLLITPKHCESIRTSQYGRSDNLRLMGNANLAKSEYEKALHENRAAWPPASITARFFTASALT
jgi:hypothetical protein